MSKMLRQPVLDIDVTRVLRCRETGRYFTGAGWNCDHREAQPFPNEAEAVRACVSNDLRNVDLVLREQGAGTELFATPLR